MSTKGPKPGQVAWNQGYEARCEGTKTNPYKRPSVRHMGWKEGWEVADGSISSGLLVDTKLSNMGKLLRLIENCEQEAHRVGVHVTAHALNRAKNALGWEISGDVEQAGLAAKGERPETSHIVSRRSEANASLVLSDDPKNNSDSSK